MLMHHCMAPPVLTSLTPWMQFGRTPLYWAAIRGRLKVTEALLKGKANPDLQDTVMRGEG